MTGMLQMPFVAVVTYYPPHTRTYIHTHTHFNTHKHNKRRRKSKTKQHMTEYIKYRLLAI